MNPTNEMIDLSAVAYQAWSSLQREGSETTSLPEELPIDVSAVYDRSGNSVRRTLVILKSFLSGVQGTLDDLNHAVDLEDRSEIKFAAHTVKSLLLDVEAVPACQMAKELEKGCESATVEALHTGAIAVTDSTKKVVRLIQSIVATAEPG